MFNTYSRNSSSTHIPSPQKGGGGGKRGEEGAYYMILKKSTTVRFHMISA